MAFDVFISYPHQDKATADAACAKLEAEGVRCWIAPRDIAPSAEWAGAIVDAIDQCRAMVLIFSSSANGSKQIHREVQQAFDGEKPVVPFRIENVMPESSLRYYMGSVHWLDAITPPLDQHLEKLAASVVGLVRAATSDGANQTNRMLRDADAQRRAEEERTRQPKIKPRADEEIKKTQDEALRHGESTPAYIGGFVDPPLFKRGEYSPSLLKNIVDGIKINKKNPILYLGILFYGSALLVLIIIISVVVYALSHAHFAP